MKSECCGGRVPLESVTFLVLAASIMRSNGVGSSAKNIYEFAFLEYFDMSVVSNLLMKEGICTKLLNTGRILPALWNASSLDYSYVQSYGSDPKHCIFGKAGNDLAENL